MSNTSTNRMLTTGPGASDAEPPDSGLDIYRSMRGIEVRLTAELGRLRISVQELLRLQIDDVLVLSRPTGENVELYAGDVLLGNAEILGSNERLAIRIAELLDKPLSSPSRASDSRQSTGSLALTDGRSDES